MMITKPNSLVDNPHTNLSQNLKKLLKEHEITISDLARSTNLPQSTLNQLCLGTSTSPRVSTLIPVARFFNVSINTLLGIDQNTDNINYFSNLPVIEWEQIPKWIDSNNDFNFLTLKNWVITDKKVDKLSFAIKSTRAMEPIFIRNSILIVDSARILQDGTYIVVGEQNGNCKIKRIIKDGSDIFLESINNLVDKTKIRYHKEHHIIYGFIREVRFNPESDQNF